MKKLTQKQFQKIEIVYASITLGLMFICGEAIAFGGFFHIKGLETAGLVGTGLDFVLALLGGVVLHILEDRVVK